MHIAMFGTRGVPALYGGFETAVEEIGVRLAEAGHRVTVYARNPGQSLTEYRGMDVVNVPAVRNRSLETLSHAMLSGVHTRSKLRPDVIFAFNAAVAPVATRLNKRVAQVALNVDGIEWWRSKWGNSAKR